MCVKGFDPFKVIDLIGNGKYAVEQYYDYDTHFFLPLSGSWLKTMIDKEV